MTKIAAIPTTYAGVRFRSRLEAKWAAFFDLLTWPWEYEPLDLDGYVPDFILRFAAPIAVEVKPLLWLATGEEAEIIAVSRAKFLSWEREALLVGSCIGAGDGLSFIGELREPDHGTASWDRAFTFRCLDCGRPSFAHSSCSWRCRVTGCYEGDGHIARDEWDPAGDFRAASNRVQWRAA